jgi:plastocyanin
MKHARTILMAAAVFSLAAASPMAGGNDDQHNNIPKEAWVQFGDLVTPAPAANTVEAAKTHFLLPDDVTIEKGGTVTFIVNGGGHGIAIHRVSKRTSRQDIAEDLCQGGLNEADRAGRFVVCNGNIVTGVGTIVGTQNLAYQITDRRGDLVIDAPQNIANNNPRLDDPDSSPRLLATSGRSKACAAGEVPPACDPSAPSTNPAGAFLTGAAPPVPPATAFTPGNRIQVQFNKGGRYLVICMNRAHSLNDHMFGFVNVVGDDDDDHDW